MTVETQVTKVSAAGNDVATVFSFSPLVIFESGDLQVTHVDSDGVETLLAENTDYTVSVASYPGTGSITYPVSGTPLATGDKLVMKRVLPITQPTDLDNQGGYFPDTQEQALDRLTMICLQQQEEIDRSVKVPIGSATDPDDLVDQINTTAASASASATAAAASAGAAAGSANDAAASAATAQGYAASLNLPDITGNAGRMLRVNAGATGYELRSPNEVRTDIGAAGTSVANTFTASQTIQSSDAGAFFSPVLTLDRASPSPAVSDELGLIEFRGRDAGGNATSYAAIYANIQATTDGAEGGALIFRTMQSGTSAIAGYFNKGLVVGAPTGTDKGTGTINAVEFYRNGVAIQSLPGMAKGWCTFNTSGTIIASHNVTSVSDNGTGNWTVNWNTDFASAAHTDTFMIEGSSATRNLAVFIGSRGADTTNVQTVNDGSGSADEAGVSALHVVAFGVQ